MTHANPKQMEPGQVPTRLHDLDDVDLGSVTEGAVFLNQGALQAVNKAANPGTATSTDAAVINAIVTALRNAHIVT